MDDGELIKAGNTAFPNIADKILNNIFLLL